MAHKCRCRAHGHRVAGGGKRGGEGPQPLDHVLIGSDTVHHILKPPTDKTPSSIPSDRRVRMSGSLLVHLAHPALHVPMTAPNPCEARDQNGYGWMEGPHSRGGGWAGQPGVRRVGRGGRGLPGHVPSPSLVGLPEWVMQEWLLHLANSVHLATIPIHDISTISGHGLKDGVYIQAIQEVTSALQLPMPLGLPAVTDTQRDIHNNGDPQHTPSANIAR